MAFSLTREQTFENKNVKQSVARFERVKSYGTSRDGFYSPCTGLFKMTVGVLTTCHTQYTSDSSICVSLFNRTALPVFVTYLTGALYVHRL
jgi:hypothetical protein